MHNRESRLNPAVGFDGAPGVIEASPNFMTARTLTRMLRDRTVSALELLELHLERVKEVNSSINAVISIDDDLARSRAKQADESLATGVLLGPLHGLPMTIKDSLETVGLPTTCGIPALRNHMPTRDATAIANLRAAGVTIFGKTNVPERAGDHQTYNSIYGRTNNPWNLARTPGGSSGGAAAAVATGMTPLEIGSDIAGSIRVPAHFCGVYGLNPSYGLVPLRGHIPPSPGSLSELVMAVVGPIARSAYDLELALDVLATPNELDRKGKVWILPPSRQERLTDFRVALWLDDPHLPLDPRYADAIRAFARELRRLGVKVTDARPQIDTNESTSVFSAILFGMWSSSLTDAEYGAYVTLAAQLDFEDHSWAARIGRGSAQTIRDWNHAIERREQIRRVWKEFFQRYDVLICPVIATIAFPHDTSGVDHTAQLKRTVLAGDTRIPYLDLLLWPGITTLPRLPSTVMPIGQFVEGLPVGVQIVSDYLDDRTTLRFAQLLEDTLGGFSAPPENGYTQRSR